MKNDTNFKQYYQERFGWIFRYTSKNFLYCFAKTLCIIVGLPIYSVMFVIEMIFTAINMIFSWIPIINVVVMIICKSIIFVCDKTFYICILTDIKKYRDAMTEVPNYEILDEDDTSSVTTGTDSQENIEQ